MANFLDIPDIHGNLQKVNTRSIQINPAVAAGQLGYTLKECQEKYPVLFGPQKTPDESSSLEISSGNSEQMQAI